ncbi:hypothetical protein ACHAXN_005618 [Cyclotella atomus]
MEKSLNWSFGKLKLTTVSSNSKSSSNGKDMISASSTVGEAVTRTLDGLAVGDAIGPPLGDAVGSIDGESDSMEVKTGSSLIGSEKSSKSCMLKLNLSVGRETSNSSPRTLKLPSSDSSIGIEKSTACVGTLKLNFVVSSNSPIGKLKLTGAEVSRPKSIDISIPPADSDSSIGIEKSTVCVGALKLNFVVGMEKSSNSPIVPPAAADGAFVKLSLDEIVGPDEGMDVNTSNGTENTGVLIPSSTDISGTLILTDMNEPDASVALIVGPTVGATLDMALGASVSSSTGKLNTVTKGILIDNLSRLSTRRLRLMGNCK